MKLLIMMKLQRRGLEKPDTVPVNPEAIPPQYTVQFFGLDWFTTSSNLNCLVLSICRKKTKMLMGLPW